MVRKWLSSLRSVLTLSIDFLESVLPYLFSSNNLEEKCDELKAYCEVSVWRSWK